MREALRPAGDFAPAGGGWNSRRCRRPCGPGCKQAGATPIAHVDADRGDDRGPAPPPADAPLLLQGLRSSVLPLSFATWNCASLLGTIASDPQRRRRKWRTVSHLIETHDLIGLQEARGDDGDFSRLPSSHHWVGTFMAFSSTSGGSSGGGCVIGLRQRLRGLFPRVRHQVLLQGRAHALLCLPADSDDGILFVNLHMQPASQLVVRKGIIDSIAAIVAQNSRCIPVAVGDWNFVHADGPRVDLRRLEEVSAYDTLATHFERRLSHFIELEQMAPTRRQMSDGFAMSASRLDRVYARLCPAEMGKIILRVLALGDAFRSNNPLDHIPVSARISIKSRRDPHLSVPIAAALCRSPELAAEAARLIGALPDNLSAFVLCDCVTESFREAARRASKLLAAKRSLPAALLAQTALGVFRASRRGDSQGVERGVRANRDLSAFVEARSRAVVGPTGLMDYVRSLSIRVAEEERLHCGVGYSEESGATKSRGSPSSREHVAHATP